MNNVMKKKLININDSLTEFELMSQKDSGCYLLKLYISGNTPKSERAIINLKKICEENLKGRYTLEVIDLYQKPALAKDADLIAVPTLIIKLPLPMRRVIGDMSEKDKVLMGLDLRKISEG
jgi:circadian clock protein KaiB